MNKRTPNQIKTVPGEFALLIRVSIIVLLIAVLLICGCGKGKTNGDIPTSETESREVPTKETTSPSSRPEESQPETESTADSSSEETDEEVSDAIFYPVNSGAFEFRSDYGFSENRAWVRNDASEYDLINPEGEIIYHIPAAVTVDGYSDPVYWTPDSDYNHVGSFNPVKNGTTYITGKIRYQYDISVIIDADGNELAHFIGTDDMDCYIAGRTDDRFLLICIDKSGIKSKLYCIPIGKDGKPADVPRLISEGSMSRDSLEVSDMGEGIFYFDNLDAEYFAYYNLNNNTVQKSVSWEGKNKHNSRFYNGTALVNGYLLTSDMLQEDRINLILSKRIFDTVQHTYSQQGRIWDGSFNEIHVYDYNGDEIDIPKEIGKGESLVEIQGSDDGYVLMIEYASTGKILLSMMDPDNDFLYIQKVFPEEKYPKIGRGGYVLLSDWEDNGLIDRDGEFHSLKDDLSKLPGLSELYFMGFGSGHMLESEMHLDSEKQNSASAIVRSLDGRQEVTSFKKTSDTHRMSDTFTNDTVIDLSKAKPIGSSEGSNTLEPTSEDEIRRMGEFGIIVADSFWDETQEVLLFEKDGVSITLNDWNLIVENANPDNKKASVYLSNMFYDGIYIDKNYPGSSGGTDLLKSGESDEIYCGVFDSEERFMREVGGFATGLAELPLTEITMRFNVQIGSTAEPVEYTRVLRTTSYSEENLSAIYGDFVDDFEYEGELIYSVYRIQDDNANVFAIRNRTDAELFAKYYPWFAECAWYVNGERYGGIFQLVIPPAGIGLVTFSDVDSIYKELELPNGTPLNLELSIPLPDFENEFFGNVIRLDLGEISN